MSTHIYTLTNRRFGYGFTIVELLVVVIVISVVTAITVIGYGAWQKNAREAQVKSDLSQAASAMEAARNFSEGYPSSIPATFSPSSDVEVTISPSSTLTSYCIDAKSLVTPSIVYHIDSSSSDNILEGPCES